MTGRGVSILLPFALETEDRRVGLAVPRVGLLGSQRQFQSAEDAEKLALREILHWRDSDGGASSLAERTADSRASVCGFSR